MVQNQTFSGMTKISGTAYDPDGRILQVYVSFDDAFYATATYGSDRSAACAALTDVPACPKIGFDLNFDTKRLSNGPHYLRVIVYDDFYSYTQFPSGYSYTFNVQN